MKNWNAIRVLWGAVVLASSSAVHAYTVNECTENWYPLAKPGERSYEQHPEKKGICVEQKITVKGRQLVEIGGKGYFMTDSKRESTACPRSGDGVGIPIPACILPSKMQRNVVHEERGYHLMTPHGADLRRLGESWYSTDGRTVFLLTTPIEGADPATFEAFDTSGADGHEDWAKDRYHIYHGDEPMQDMALGEMQFVGPFVINAGRVFEVGLSSVKERPDVLPTLTMVVPENSRRSLVSDGRRLYLRGKAVDSLSELDGYNGADIKTLSPTCPIAGHPDLRCKANHPQVFDNGPESRLALAGNDVLYFRGVNDVKRIANVPDLVFFRPDNTPYVLGISGQRLYTISGPDTSPVAGPSFRGRISGPIAGAIVDEEGFITSFPQSNLKKCSTNSRLPAWPKAGDSSRFGALRQLAETEIPEGFAVALENERYRYLFVSREKRSAGDTVIDRNDGRSVLADCRQDQAGL